MTEHADRELDRFLRVCRNNPDGNGVHDPAANKKTLRLIWEYVDIEPSDHSG